MLAATGTDNHGIKNSEERKHLRLTNSNWQTTNNTTAAHQSVSTSQKYIFQANNSSLNSNGDFCYKWSGQSLSKKASFKINSHSDDRIYFSLHARKSVTAKFCEKKVTTTTTKSNRNVDLKLEEPVQKRKKEENV